MWLFMLLAGIILILAGLGFTCSGLASVAIFGVLPLALPQLSPDVAPEVAAIPALFGAGFSAIFVVVGLVLTAGGGALTFFGIRLRRKLKVEHLRIMDFGVEAEGTITFIDRNYGMLVNNRPVYSIVEYTFGDRMERQHTGRDSNLPSDYAIRQKLEVGSKIRVKYLPDDPGQSLIVQE